MLSRVAESVFWMSRYMERADNVARFVDVNQNLTLDLGDVMQEQWQPLVLTTGDEEQFREKYGVANRKNALQFLTFDTENPNSIFSCVTRAQKNARSIRENISTEMWEEINTFYLMVRDAAENSRLLYRPYDFFQQVKLAGHSVLGAVDTTMTHNEAWHFGRLGRLVERADKTSRILDVKYYILLPEPRDVGTPLDIVQWASLLKSAGALEMYRRLHGQIVPVKVVEFLMLDRDFPRSFRFCLIGAEESVHLITGTAAGTFQNLAEQRLGRLRSELDYTDTQDIVERGLHEFIDGLQVNLNGIGNAVAEAFFRPSSGELPSYHQQVI